ITRRNMLVKSSSKRASSASKAPAKSTNASRAASKDDDDDEDMDDDDDSSRSFLNTAPVQPLNPTESGEAMRWKVNALNWQATGVISDLPPRSASTASDARRDVSRHRALKADHEARHRTVEDMDTAMAAEMALREVLGRVKEASVRSAQAGLFDFDL